jgi:hypothetical protein
MNFDEPAPSVKMKAMIFRLMFGQLYRQIKDGQIDEALESCKSYMKQCEQLEQQATEMMSTKVVASGQKRG